MDSSKTLSLNYFRRFGVEIEINSFDLLSRPNGHENGVLPLGIHYVGDLIKKTTNEKVLIHKWGYDHNNDIWVVKPDASCGMEVCTPVLKGWQGILQLCRVVQAFQIDDQIVADERCSFHVHVDVSDLSESQISKIISWWIKCEPVFMDSVPPKRKYNQYCQFIGLTNIVDNVEKDMMSPEHIIEKLGDCKYYTLNTYHYSNKKRKTIEFRIMDNECCLNPWAAKNWTRLVLHFIEMSLNSRHPTNYKIGDKWSGYCWLDPIDVFDFLGLSGNFELSPGLEQVKVWFLSRLASQSKNTNLKGIMSDTGRRISHLQIDDLTIKNSVKKDEESDINKDLYSDNFRV